MVISNRLLLVLLVFTGALAQGALGQTSDARPGDEALIREASAEWGRAALSKNLDKTVSFYAEDASYFPPGAPVVVGKDAIRKAWADSLAIPGMKLTTTTTKVDVARSGDLAYGVRTCLVRRVRSFQRSLWPLWDYHRLPDGSNPDSARVCRTVAALYA
jgi:ketosteroid isomerase-like protein